MCNLSFIYPESFTDINMYFLTMSYYTSETDCKQVCFLFHVAFTYFIIFFSFYSIYCTALLNIG